MRPAGEPAAGEGPDDPVGRAGGPEQREQVGDGGLDLLVGVDHHRALVVVHEPSWQGQTQLAPGGRGTLGLVHAAGQDVQLGLRHGAFQPQQHPVVKIRKVVDAVGVDDQGVGQAGQLQQLGQVGRGAGQAGDLQAEDGTNLAQADPAHHLLEPGAALG